MTYWLVGEEPWRTRRSCLTTIEPETTTLPQPQSTPVVDSTVRELPLMLDTTQTTTELDPLDTSPSTWLLADCPVIPEGDQLPEYEPKLPQLNNGVDMKFDDRNNCTLGHYQSPNSLIRQQTTRDKSCKTCTSQIHENGGKLQRLMSPRYRSAPIITANSTFRGSSPTIPLRTTSPQSCV